MSTAGISSMTGYAVQDVTVNGFVYRVHLKSVNHRHFELKWKAPRAWAPLELEARALFQKTLHRGAVDCWIESTTPEGVSEAGAKTLFERLSSALNESQSSKLPRFIRALVLARFPEAWISSKHDTAVPTEAALEGLQPVLEKLLETRVREGRRLAEVIGISVQRLEELLQTVQSKLVDIQTLQRSELKKRLEVLAEEMKVPGPSDQKLAQEFLILAEKRDASEEMERIRIHLSNAHALLQSAPTHLGKKLEFMAQELLREWTTLGTKIHDPHLVSTVMDAKLELDRIREQAANIA